MDNKENDQLNNVNNFKKDLNYSQLGYYLTGLIESDGYIGTKIKELSENKLKIITTIQITYNLKDLPSAIILKNIINAGTISYPSKRSCRLNFNSKNDKLKIIHLINGKIRSPKYYALKNIINALNIKYPNLILEILPLDKSPININSWFSGFSDGDASFRIIYTESFYNIKTNKFSKNRIALNYRLEQRIIDPKSSESYQFIINDISIFFKSKIYISKHNNPPINYYLVSLYSSIQIKLLVDYFNKFPIINSKQLDYLDWLKCHKIILNKEHLTIEGKTKIKHLK